MTESTTVRNTFAFRAARQTGSTGARRHGGVLFVLLQQVLWCGSDVMHWPLLTALVTNTLPTELREEPSATER